MNDEAQNPNNKNTTLNRGAVDAAGVRNVLRRHVGHLDSDGRFNEHRTDNGKTEEKKSVTV